MVKNVTVTVVGEQRTSREENNVEPIELVTRGSLHEKDEAFYSTPVGMMNISILTEGYQLVETEKGFGLVVVYVMDYGNECVSFNVLRITVE